MRRPDDPADSAAQGAGLAEESLASAGLATEEPAPEQQLPPPRSVQAPPSLWWWFLVLAALIGVWILSMLFMRGPLAPSAADPAFDGAAGSAGGAP